MIYRQLLDQLSHNPSMVQTILEGLPIHSLSINEGKARFDTCEHSSKAYTLDLCSLTYFNFRTSEGGDFYKLIEELTGKDKKTSYNELYILLLSSGNITIVGECETDSCSFEYELKHPEPYPSDSLDSFPRMVSDMFLEDNIWATTQWDWGIRYSYQQHRVIIPVYQDEELVGAIGRLNKETVESHENKYFPILKYSKSLVLFGLDHYRDKVKELRTVVIVESEKSCIKASQLNFKFPVLAIGCSSISRHHIERLNVFGLDNIILCLDKGIESENVLNSDLGKLNKYSNAKNIYYVDVDSTSDLELKDKECLFDKTDIKDINKLFKKYLKKV